MPSEKEEAQHAPDTHRTYERAMPENETPQGQMTDPGQGDNEHPDSVQGSLRNDVDRQPMTADDIQRENATADPSTTAKADPDPRHAIPNAAGQPAKQPEYIGTDGEPEDHS